LISHIEATHKTLIAHQTHINKKMFRLLLDESPESLAAQQQAPIIDAELSAIDAAAAAAAASAGNINNSNSNTPSTLSTLSSSSSQQNQQHHHQQHGHHHQHHHQHNHQHTNNGQHQQRLSNTNSTSNNSHGGQNNNNSNNNLATPTSAGSHSNITPSPFHLSSASTPPSQLLQNNPFLPSTPLLSTPSPQLPNIFQTSSTPAPIPASNSANVNNNNNGNNAGNSGSSITPTQQFMQHHHQHLQQQQQQQPSLMPATPTYVSQQRLLQQQQGMYGNNKGSNNANTLQQPQAQYPQQQQQQLPSMQQYHHQQHQQHQQQGYQNYQQQQQSQYNAQVIVDVIELSLNNRMTGSSLYVPSFFVQDLIACNVFAAQNVLQLAQQFDINSPSVVHVSDRNLPDFNETFVACGGSSIVQQVPPLLQQQLASSTGQPMQNQQRGNPPAFRIFDETTTLISFSLLQESANVKLGHNVLFSTKCNVWYDMNKHRWVVGTDMPVENSAHAPPSYISWVPQGGNSGEAPHHGNQQQSQQQHVEYHHGQQFYQQQQQQQYNSGSNNAGGSRSASKRKREPVENGDGTNQQLQMHTPGDSTGSGTGSSPNDSNSPGSDDGSAAPGKKKQRKQRHVKKVGEIVKEEQGKHIVIVEVAQLQLESANQQNQLQQQQQQDGKKTADFYLPAGRVGDLAEFLTRDRTSIFRAATRNAFEDDAYPDGVYLTKDTAKKFNHEIGDTFHNYCGVHGRHDASVLIRLELLKEFVKHGYELQPVIIFSKKLFLTYESAGKRWIANESP